MIEDTKKKKQLEKIVKSAISVFSERGYKEAQMSHIAQEARIVAQAHGHEPGMLVIGAPPVFLFEPHQPEQCEFKPQLLLDITSVWPKKYEAFKAMNAQEHLWHYYERVALQRGVQASRNSNKTIKYGEAYQRVFPQVTGELA